MLKSKIYLLTFHCSLSSTIRNICIVDFCIYLLLIVRYHRPNDHISNIYVCIAGTRGAVGAHKLGSPSDEQQPSTTPPPSSNGVVHHTFSPDIPSGTSPLLDGAALANSTTLDSSKVTAKNSINGKLQSHCLSNGSLQDLPASASHRTSKKHSGKKNEKCLDKVDLSEKCPDKVYEEVEVYQNGGAAVITCDMPPNTTNARGAPAPPPPAPATAAGGAAGQTNNGSLGSDDISAQLLHSPHHLTGKTGFSFKLTRSLSIGPQR